MKHIVWTNTAPAILAYHVGPTNTKGARVSVRSDYGPRLLVPCDARRDFVGNCHMAAVKLCERNGWHNPKLLRGNMPKGYVYLVLECDVDDSRP